MVNDHPRNLSCRAVLTFDSPWAPILGNTGSKNAAGTSWHYYYEQEATSNEGITTSSKNATRCTHNILRPKSRGGHTPLSPCSAHGGDLSEAYRGVLRPCGPEAPRILPRACREGVVNQRRASKEDEAPSEVVGRRRLVDVDWCCPPSGGFGMILGVLGRCHVEI